MKFEEILPALREGKKIKHNENVYFIKKERDRTYLFRNKEYDYYTQFDTDHILSEDWEVLEEPKKKVKYYPVLVKDCTMRKYGDYKISLSTTLYKNMEEAIKDFYMYPGAIVIRLITEIPELIEEREE